MYTDTTLHPQRENIKRKVAPLESDRRAGQLWVGVLILPPLERTLDLLRVEEAGRRLLTIDRRDGVKANSERKSLRTIKKGGWIMPGLAGGVNPSSRDPSQVSRKDGKKPANRNEWRGDVTCARGLTNANDLPVSK